MIDLRPIKPLESRIYWLVIWLCTSTPTPLPLGKSLSTWLKWCPCCSKTLGVCSVCIRLLSTPPMLDVRQISLPRGCYGTSFASELKRWLSWTLGGKSPWLAIWVSLILALLTDPSICILLFLSYEFLWAAVIFVYSLILSLETERRAFLSWTTCMLCSLAETSRFFL